MPKRSCNLSGNVDLVSDLMVVLADDGYNPEQYASQIFKVISFKDIPIPDRRKMCFQYEIMELNTAVKPFAIKHLFSVGYEKIVYLDPDILVYSPLEKTFAALDLYDAVVTPHLTEPLDDKFRPADLDILKAGTSTILGSSPQDLRSKLQSLSIGGRKSYQITVESHLRKEYSLIRNGAILFHHLFEEFTWIMTQE